MSLPPHKHKSLCQLPRIQQTTSLQTAKILEKYLTRMRSVHMPQYSKQNKGDIKQLTRHVLRRTPTKKHSFADQTVILRTIDTYIDCLKTGSLQKSTQRYRRLVNRVSELIQTHPSIQQKLFDEEDTTKLITDGDILKMRLTDEHQPVLAQIIEKIGEFNSEEESFELFSMGGRIKTLKASLATALECPFETEHKGILKIREQNRPNETISRNLASSSKKYGEFSKELCKREEFFSKLNKVVDLISQKPSQ